MICGGDDRVHHLATTGGNAGAKEAQGMVWYLTVQYLRDFGDYVMFFFNVLILRIVPTY